MALPVMDSDLVSREYLRIGGGYGASALGQSPAGGLDVDNGGNVATNGDVTIEGALTVGQIAGNLSVEGVFENWSCWIPAREMWPEGSGGGSAVGPTRTIWAWGRETQTYDFAPSVQQKLCFSFALPRGYDGRELTYNLFWTANDGTSGNAFWGVYAVSHASGGLLTENFSALGPSVTEFEGTSKLHVTPLVHTPTLASVDDRFVLGYLARRGTDASDTFDGTVRLIGIEVGFA